MRLGLEWLKTDASAEYVGKSSERESWRRGKNGSFRGDRKSEIQSAVFDRSHAGGVLLRIDLFLIVKSTGNDC